MKTSIVVVSNRPMETIIPTMLAIEEQKIEAEREFILVYEHLEQGQAVRRCAGPSGWKYVEVPRHMGLPYNRNQGIAAATGDIIVFLDDDCDPGDDQWLSRLLAPLLRGEAHVTLGGVYIKARTFVGRCVAALGFPAGGSLGFDKVFPVDADGRTDYLSTCNCAVLTEVLVDVGGFDPSLTHGGEDTDIGLRISEKGYTMLLVREAVVEHAARETLKDFVPWQFRRGRAKGQLSRGRKTGKLVGMRLRSVREVMWHSTRQGIVHGVAPLLFASYAIQALGYTYERFRSAESRRIRGGTGTA